MYKTLNDMNEIGWQILAKMITYSLVTYSYSYIELYKWESKYVALDKWTNASIKNNPIWEKNSKFDLHIMKYTYMTQINIG